MIKVSTTGNNANSVEFNYQNVRVIKILLDHISSIVIEGLYLFTVNTIIVFKTYHTARKQ